METRELAPGIVGQELQLARDPTQVIEDAMKVANLLKGIVDTKKLALKIGESEHLKIEGWLTCGSFYGLVGRVTKTEPFSMGEITGFKAYADLVHVASGKVVASAEAICADDEEKWDSRPKYEYHYVLRSGGHQKDDPGYDNIEWEPNPKKPGKKRPKKIRVQVGTDQVPIYQILSMSETRALSKVYSIALRWIVVLAGYAPTPVDDMEPAGAGGDNDEYPNAPDNPIQQPSGASHANQNSGGGTQAAGAGNNTARLNQAQINDLWQAGYNKNQYHGALSKDRIEEIIRMCGYRNSNQIPVTDYKRVYNCLLYNKPPESDPDPGTGVPAAGAAQGSFS